MKIPAKVHYIHPLQQSSFIIFSKLSNLLDISQYQATNKRMIEKSGMISNLLDIFFYIDCDLNLLYAAFGRIVRYSRYWSTGPTLAASGPIIRAQRHCCTIESAARMRTLLGLFIFCSVITVSRGPFHQRPTNSFYASRFTSNLPAHIAGCTA